MVSSTLLLFVPLLSCIAASSSNSTSTSTLSTQSTSASSGELFKRTFCYYTGTCATLYGSGYYSGYGSTSYSYYSASSIDTTSDKNNCGWEGNVCPLTYAHGGAGYCESGKCMTTCDPLYDFNFGTNSCQDVSSNVESCGACGSKCALVGAISATCYSGTCLATACIPGSYTLSGYVCKANVNTQTDVNNCGSVGHTCPSSYLHGSGVICAAGVCQPLSVSAGYAFNTVTKQCQDITSDASNCGSIGKVCANGKCVNSICVDVPCAAGTTRINGVCTANVINLYTDVKNCGSKGNVCPLTYAYGGAGVCESGLCTTQCNSGFDFNFNTGKCQDVSSDVENCGQCGSSCALVGALTATCYAGTCYATTCGPGYNYFGYACHNTVDTSTDVNNCGTYQHTCESSYNYGTGSVCLSGVCQPVSCHTGYSFDFTASVCVPTQTDTNNCGSVGNICSFPHGTGSCIAGICTTTTCNSGYSLVKGLCTSMNTVTDSNNCGTVGNVCKFANGLGSCVNSKCTFSSCSTGYTLVNGACSAINTQTDSKNCGTPGNVCPATYLNGGVGSCTAGVCSTVCNTGYDFDFTVGKQYCRDVSSDANNCGKSGTVCPASNGVSKCTLGVCSIASCNTGYALVSGVCTKFDTNTDVNNCGAAGNKCPTSYLHGSGVQCIAGVCQTTCSSGYDFDFTINACRDVTSDVAHCGKTSISCSFPNGSGVCSNSVCTTTKCNTGFQLVAGVCTLMDLTTDSKNCGSIGNVCSFPNGVGSCIKSVCTYTSCATGYSFSTTTNTCSKVDTATDVKNCGSVGHVCPASYANGGAAVCSAGICSTTCNIGFAFDTTAQYCRPTTSDTQNCGSIGHICSMVGTAQTSCVASVCTATACLTGYSLKAGVCTSIDTTSDVNNCGSIGHQCNFLPATATGVCLKSICTITNCPAGYVLTAGVCVKSTASIHARAKRSLTSKQTLCPTGETACPILGSASYELAVAHHFSSSANDLSGIMASGGGYECLDTAASLESCGGCASTGEGVDCTAIRGANGVGCEEGVCVIMSCELGFRKSLDGSRCLRVHGNVSNRSSTSRRDQLPRHASHAGIGHRSSHSH